MTSFSEMAWQCIARLRQAIHELPFNTELADGTLSSDRFRGYITQDAIYLSEFSRTLAIAGAKAPDGSSLQVFAESALEVVSVERAMHERYLAEFGVDAVQFSAAEPSPDCLAYTSFLLATAYQDPWEVLVAALLPCFWIYWDVGCAIAKRAKSENPYRAWIETYADEAFGKRVQQVIAITDRAAAAATDAVQTRMLSAFCRASLYEWLFWDGAYQQRDWPMRV